MGGGGGGGVYSARGDFELEEVFFKTFEQTARNFRPFIREQIDVIGYYSLPLMLPLQSIFLTGHVFAGGGFEGGFPPPLPQNEKKVWFR